MIHPGFSWNVRKSLMVMLTVVLLAAIAVTPAKPAMAAGDLIVNVNTDKAMYAPGQNVTIYVDMTNQTGSSISGGTVSIYYKHLNDEIGSDSTSLSLASGASTSKSFTWNPPDTDFRGYLVEVWVRDGSGNIVDNFNTAVDVSSSWTKFPRYGFLSEFGDMSQSEAYNRIWQLKNYHINALQFYDWHYKQHVPLAGSVTNPDSVWQDIANRDIYRETVNDFIGASDNYNLMSMFYNLFYGALTGYGEDGSGVDYRWGLYKSSDGTNPYTLKFGIDFVAACDLDESRMEQAKADFPGIRTYTTVEALLGQPDLDLVTVIAPHNTHAPLAEQVLSAGKHCILEKPMCIHAEDADRLVRLAQSRGPIFENGALAHLQISSIAHADKPMVRLLGTKGSIVDRTIWDGELMLHTEFNGVNIESPVKCESDRQEEYYRNIADHLMRGAELIVKPEEARRTIAVIETTEKSALSGKELPVPYEK